MEAANNERIQSLAAGTNGLPVQFPPNTMETMKLLVYMETLLDSNGMLNKAKYRFHKELADVLDAVEEQSRIAKLTHGTGTFQA